MLKYLFLTSLLLISSCSTTTSPTPADTQASMVQSQSQRLYVDVREDDEWAAGHVEGAIHVKLGDIQSGNYAAIPKDTPVSLYCRSGNRSGIAYDALRKAGYANITNAGGMTQLKGVKIVR